MPVVNRLNYYRRIAAAYLSRRPSQLTFWHEVPEINPNMKPGFLGEYYMLFREKADYRGPYDRSGIPLLNYHGNIGLQYNPIAIAQYGLGNYNLYKRTHDLARLQKLRMVADWLVTNLELNRHGILVWNHHFDWDYRTPLKAPWYSGLAQGQGISLLLRAHAETQDDTYLQAAHRAFEAFGRPVERGGVVFFDDAGQPWLEEYLVSPPTHILNGFIWALWGVYDYFLATKDHRAGNLFDGSGRTLMTNLDRYDAGFWSLYELSGTLLTMLASPFYHRLHIVQLKILHRLTGEDVFLAYAKRWERYNASLLNRWSALAYKVVFKLAYY